MPDDAQPQPEQTPEPEPLDKSQLVNAAMRQLKTPSYVAWSMTVPQLKKALKEAERG